MSSTAQRRSLLRWALLTLAISVLVAIVRVVIGYVFASDPPFLLALPLWILGLIGLPGTIVYMMLGGVHDSGLTNTAAVFLVSVLSGITWATVIEAVLRRSNRQHLGRAANDAQQRS